MAETKRKDTRTHLTLQQKAKLRAFLVANPGLPQFAVADWVREQFHVRLGRTTLYRIQHTPEDAFTTGNLSRKKQRRVKFPDFERRLLEFHEEMRARREDVSDDLLLRQAAECRDACGISEAELKLSNGWLYRFKIRHQLTGTPPHPGRQDDNGLQDDRPVELGLLPVLDAPPSDEDRGPVVLSARALTTVQAPGFLNWEPVGEVQQDQVVIVADGILLQQSGLYQLSVQVKHTASSNGAPVAFIFKVYSGGRVVGQCESATSVQNDVASSIWVDTSLLVSVQAVLKVKFLAPGYAFTDSSLVLRRRLL
ncbi:hypothetical protein PC129_g7992 [Phytophthora cactorum]|uniref:HTH CENPB-type domain-containing protein n=1 Tax=Phytophthora cactorum TaxID=29920 RepID=A0A329S0B9_9STRA|nr:hypothetical protein Pcac1_g23857 [Phytophthora cactorum]KAG2839122.1 hypothetical protein PC111_g3968 [Phytophthora cactorum]KAG2848472.1 hypothetical protein PC112_g722 [Phytophthora cactorum]KAG2868656.1 hypothetical protein PC113_g909 [Phytophthora cactorum]KAG2907557.1 hypothetical protein PC114_g10774 [Phytophthora cactorum]